MNDRVVILLGRLNIHACDADGELYSTRVYERKKARSGLYFFTNNSLILIGTDGL